MHPYHIAGGTERADIRVAARKLCLVYVLNAFEGHVAGTLRTFPNNGSIMVAVARKFCMACYKNRNTPQLEDRIFRRNSSLQAVCDAPIARITGCVSSLRI